MNWIKLRDDLHEDPRVFAIANAIAKTDPTYILLTQARDLFGDVTTAVTRNALRDVTIAGLARVWRAANRHTTDGVFKTANLDYLDTLAQIRGFGQAMAAVGYAVHDPAAGTVTLPRFEEHNAPDKNGHRAKSKAAERQQRYRERQKEGGADTPVRSAPEAPQTVTRDVTDTVTRDVTPSVSSSVSSSDSDSESKPSLTLDQHKARIDTLRPAWKKMPAWSCEDEAALLAALPNLDALEDKDWLMLVNYMKWANSTANQGKDSHKVTSRRHSFLESLPSYLDRATTHWKQQGCPKLSPKGSAGTPARKVLPRSPAQELPELPPAENAAAFAGLLAASGVVRRHQGPGDSRPTQTAQDSASPPIHLSKSAAA